MFSLAIEPPTLYHLPNKDNQHLGFSQSATYLYPSDLIYFFFFSAGIKNARVSIAGETAGPGGTPYNGL